LPLRAADINKQSTEYGIAKTKPCHPRNKENGMLNNKDAVATIAVKDLEAAGKFYKDTLGLAQVGAQKTNTYSSLRAVIP
jgi:hypothetical protein